MICPHRQHIHVKQAFIFLCHNKRKAYSMLFSSYYSSRIFVIRTNERASLLKTIEVFSTLLNFLLAFKKYLHVILILQFLNFVKSTFSAFDPVTTEQ